MLVVKTRRGEEGKPVIHVRAEAGGQIPVRKPNFLDSYNTALLVNEARTNDGLTKMFNNMIWNCLKTVPTHTDILM